MHINTDQRTVAEATKCIAVGTLGMGISYGVISGTDARYADAPNVNQIFLGSNGGRWLADLLSAGRGFTDVSRQHRGG